MRGSRLLVIDDDPGDAQLVSAIGATLGLGCEIVPDRAAAVASVARARPLGIVLDLRLPGGDRGESVLDAIREIAPTVPVIIVTIEDEPTHARIDAFGIDDYLTKPIDRQRLEGWMRGLAQK